MTRSISLWIGLLSPLALVPNRLDAALIPFAGEQTVTDTAVDAADVEVADLDADGDLDVTVAAASANMLAWYENLGDGTFAERVITLGLDGASDVEVGDLDGDGDLDLVATGGGQATVSRFLSVPTGPDPPSFDESAISATTILPGGFDSVTLFDIEPDGDLDVAALGRDDQELVVYTQTTGSFSSPGPIAFAGVVEVSAGDIDGDGIQDLALPSELASSVLWFRGLGTGSFSLESDSSAPDGATSFALADLHANGRTDFVAVSAPGNDIDLHRNDGAAGFTRIPLAVAFDPQDVDVVDLDADGDLDILVAAAGDDSVSWYEQTDPLTFERRIIGDASIDVARAIAADLDGDGDLDVLAASPGDDTVSWFENLTPRSTVVSTEPIPIETAHGAAVGVALGDLDRDGFMDIVGSFGTDAAAGNRVRWFTGVTIGLGVDVAVGVEQFVRGVNSVELHDLDGDGALDVLTAAPLGVAAGGGDVAWHEFDNGSFTHHRIHENATLTRHATAGDLDGDGDLDVVSAVGGESSIYWYQNDGSGVFSAETPAAPVGTVLGARSIDVGDIDHDGDLDIAFAATGEGEVGWLENNGAASPLFTRRDLPIAFAAPFWVEIGDVNGDGRPDLVASSVTTGQVAWFRNAGGLPATFDSGFINAGGLQGATGLALADLDADGDLDVTVTARNADRAVWLENPGGADVGLLIRRPLPVVLDGALAVAVGDRLRDGVLDLVVACESSQGLALIPNARAIFWENFERGDAAVWSAEVP